MSELQQLQQRRQQMSEQLDSVERQIYDLETTYLQRANPNANAFKGG
jgi:chaperonin cofactor prefoldin